MPRRAWDGLIERMRMWSGQTRSCKRLFSAVVIEPALLGFKACNDWVASSCVVFRGMLVWRGIATTNVPTLGAPPEMNPPPLCFQALDATSARGLGGQIDTVSI